MTKEITRISISVTQWDEKTGSKLDRIIELAQKVPLMKNRWHKQHEIDQYCRTLNIKNDENSLYCEVRDHYEDHNGIGHYLLTEDNSLKPHSEEARRQILLKTWNPP